MKKLLLLLSALSVTLCIQPYWGESKVRKARSAASSAASSVKSAVVSGAEKTASTFESGAKATKDAVVSGAGKAASAVGGAAKATKDIIISGGEKIKMTAEDLMANAKETFDSAQAIAQSMAQNFENIMKKPAPPQYCNQAPLQPYALTTNDPQVVAADTEKMIPIIEKYSPIAYLFNERYGPIAVEDYFTAPTTQLVYQPDHNKNPNALKQVIIPAGQISMEKIYEQWKLREGKPNPDLYFDIAECTTFGSNPAKFNNSQGDLTVPVYVMYFTQNGKIYINYIFNYGLNGPYTIKIPGTGLPMLKGDIQEFQNAHEFDLEHVTYELNGQTKQLERIFYAAHGSAEGVWLPANHSDVQYEGTHPVVFVANGGHGCYPREGAHVRVYGFANDHTRKQQRWAPQLVLLYPDTDPRFNPKTMGWMYHPGNYGKRGVSGLALKDWFLNSTAELQSGQSQESVPFCSAPTGKIDRAKFEACTFRKRKQAKPPH